MNDGMTALASVLQETDARAADVARLESELVGLRETVMRARRDAEHSAAAAKSLTSELAAAESALMSAREVDRAGDQRPGNCRSHPFDRLPQLGCRQAMRRRFGCARARVNRSWPRSSHAPALPGLKE
jgi:hypothetical protein